MTKKILITGGLGFIGSALLEYMWNRDAEIHVANRLRSVASYKNREKWADRLGGKLHIMDVAQDEDAITSLIRKEQFDVIVHLAARAGVRESSLYPQQYTQDNVMGTLNILTAARGHSPRTRCILASSSTVCAIPICSYYGFTKKVVEDMAQLFSHAHGMDIACLRFFSVYGTDCRQDLLIGGIIRSIREGKPLTIYGNGDIRRDFTYIDDTLEAICRTMDKQWSGYVVADIGTGTNHSVQDVIRLLNTSPYMKEHLKVIHEDGRREDAMVSKADTEEAMRCIDFRPATHLREGLDRVLRAVVLPPEK